jgi:capsular polysaccharide biosynthesis protein
MTDSQNKPADKQTDPTSAQEEAYLEDEINFIEYFKVLWKRKGLVLLGSVLPALIIGLILFSLPKNYKATYVYDVKDRNVYDVKGQSGYDTINRSYDVSNWHLNEKNYNVLLDRFYSEENLNKITNKLRENSLDRYVKLINGGGGCLKEFVYFDIWPPYTDVSRAKITELSQLEHIRQLNAHLLNVTIVARPRNDISKICTVIRDNLENVIPVYVAEEHLNADIRGFKAKIAAIDENRFDLELALKTNNTILAKLKNIKTPVSDRIASNIALQFDISGKTEYLPVEYQIQAAESKTIHDEGQVTANEKNRSYYEDLLALNEKLLAELKNKMSSYYTIRQFHSFLTDLMGSYEDSKLRSYLNSYVKRIENRMSASTPVTKKPNISTISRRTVKKAAIALAISLIISVFAAFSLEGLEKSRGRAS